MAGQYQYLFTPIRIGQTTIANRIVFAAHLTNLAEDNLPGPRLIAYYTERARGGCGLIITEEQSRSTRTWYAHVRTDQSQRHAGQQHLFTPPGTWAIAFTRPYSS